MDFQVMLNKLLHQRPNVEKCSYLYLFKSQEQKMEKNSVSFSVDEKSTWSKYVSYLCIFCTFSLQ